jgi:1-acyl-sn-glycerol-3-phosphate acyltransferase
VDVVDSEWPGLLTLGLYGLALIALLWRQQRRSGLGWQAWLLYGVARGYCGLMFQWRSNRHCPLPERGPAIVVSNHRSPLDPQLLWVNHHFGWNSPRRRVISFIMAREFYEKRGIAWICRAMQSIPIDRSGQDMEGVRTALKVLENGGLLGLFPEGRINRGESLLEGDTGVAWLALRSRAPVYPVYIHNAPGGRNMLEPFCTPSRARLTWGEPVDLSAYYDRRKSQDVLREVTGLLMRRLAELGGTAGPSADGDEADVLSLPTAERRNA